MGKKRFGLAVALGLVLGCLGGCEEKEKIEIVDGHETIILFGGSREICYDTYDRVVESAD